MNLQLPRRLLVTALFAIGAVSSAQAANYVEIDGANVKFFYDADFWGLGAASVSGNSIAFSISDEFAVVAKTGSSTGVSNVSHFDQVSAAVLAVAKTGYSVSSAVNANAKGSYSFTTGNSTVGGRVLTTINGGTFGSGSFVYQSSEGSFDAYNYILSYDTASTGNLLINDAGGNATNYFKAVSLDTYIEISAAQYRKGRTDAALTEVSYNFGVSAVPEPETYAMMIAGLGLVGFAARRRKTAA